MEKHEIKVFKSNQRVRQSQYLKMNKVGKLCLALCNINKTRMHDSR